MKKGSWKGVVLCASFGRRLGMCASIMPARMSFRQREISDCDGESTTWAAVMIQSAAQHMINIHGKGGGKPAMFDSTGHWIG